MTVTESTETVDVIVECYWERNPDGTIELDCRFSSLDGSEAATEHVTAEDKQRIEEVVMARIPYVQHQMEDVARARIFEEDTPPAVLLLVDPVEDTTPHDLEVAALPNNGGNW